MVYDCIIVGGGIAGLQAAIQLGRYEHKILVVDSNQGRSSICRSYHNILGYPNGISGQQLRDIGKRQAEDLGVEFVIDTVQKAKTKDGQFILTSDNNKHQYEGKRLLIATGVVDRIPLFDSLVSCLGKSVYVCPDCDGHEIKNKRTIVMGSGNVGANMALTLMYWTNELMYINHEQEEVSSELLEKLNKRKIQYENQAIKEIETIGDQFKGVVLNNGKRLTAEKGFVAFGGNEVRSDLAKQLGVERLENKHIPVHPRSKMTNIKNIWAAGDVVAHSELVTMAMGEGSQAAIWIHKSLI